MKILICGFMGAGKSFWLLDLKKQSGASGFLFLDLDQEIAQALHLSPSQLGEWISAPGWESFRKLEQEKIHEFLSHETSGVLCLGGGALVPDLLVKIKQNPSIKLVFLDTPFEVCHERIIGDSNRPLSSIKKEELRELYLQRLASYRQADLILDERERKEIEGINSLVHTLGGPKKLER